MLWNEISDNSKLKQIKLTIGISASFQRDHHMEVVLSHLRIGHTLLTHVYLINTPHDQVPQCTQRGTGFTIKHILIDCPVFARQSMSSIGNKTVKAILSDSPTFSTYPIVKFLRSFALLNKI